MSTSLVVVAGSEDKVHVSITSICSYSSDDKNGLNTSIATRSKSRFLRLATQTPPYEIYPALKLGYFYGLLF